MSLQDPGLLSGSRPCVRSEITAARAIADCPRYIALVSDPCVKSWRLAIGLSHRVDREQLHNWMVGMLAAGLATCPFRKRQRSSGAMASSLPNPLGRRP